MGTTADKLTYLNTTKGKIKDSINLTGANIGNNDTFRSYAVKLRDGLLDIINNGTATLYNNFPKVSGTGSSIILNDTLEAPMRNKMFKGNTLQNGTPTPSTPIEIQSVEGIQNITISDGTDSNSYEVNLEGKNLFDKNNANILNALINGTTKVISAFNSCRTLYINCKSNTTYTISRLAGTRFIIGTTTNVPITSMTCNSIIQDNEASIITITTGANDNYLCVFYYNSGSDTLTEQQILDSIQIEKGNTATSYVPYRSPIKLYNGDKIVGTPDNWSIYREYNNIILNGTQTIAIANWRPGETSVGWVYNYNEFNNAYVPASTIGDIISNKLIASKFDDLFQKNKDNGIAVYVNTDYSIAVRTSDTTLTTSTLINNYLNNNPIEVVYKLATPTTTSITDTYLISQLNALYNAKSYNGQTNISVSGNLPMILEVSALKDEI